MKNQTVTARKMNNRTPGVSTGYILQCILLSCYFQYHYLCLSQSLVGLCLAHKNFTIKLMWINYSLISWFLLVRITAIQHSLIVSNMLVCLWVILILQKYSYSVNFLLLPRWKIFYYPTLLMKISLALNDTWSGNNVLETC